MKAMRKSMSPFAVVRERKIPECQNQACPPDRPFPLCP
jgi:hypothetical protein